MQIHVYIKLPFLNYNLLAYFIHALMTHIMMYVLILQLLLMCTQICIHVDICFTACINLFISVPLHTIYII